MMDPQDLTELTERMDQLIEAMWAVHDVLAKDVEFTLDETALLDDYEIN